MNKWARALLAPVTVTLVAGAAAAPAQAFPDTRKINCGQAQALVRSSGAAVLSTSALVYDRYVVSRAYCPMDQQTDPAWVPTRDKPQCFVGYTCYDPTRDRK